MYNVFNKVPTIVGTSFGYQGMPYVRSQIQRNVEMAKQYYRTNYFRVRSDHVLCKIIQSIDVDMDLPLVDYIRAVDLQADGMYTLHGITSGTMRSKPNFRGDFFGEGSVELYMADHRDIDPASEWRDLVPVTACSHFRSDLLPVRLGLPFKSTERGLAVLQINVVALMVQYRGWYQSLEASNKGVEQFVGHYPLVNVLESVTDVAVFNRHYNHLMGIPQGTPATNVPFMTLNNEGHLDRVCKIVRDKILSTMMGPASILMNIPVVYAESAYHLQAHDQYIPTDQLTWALVGAKMRYVGLVLEYLEQSSYGDARGTKLRLVLRRTVNQLIGNKLLVNGIHRTVSDYLCDYMYTEIVPRL